MAVGNSRHSCVARGQPRTQPGLVAPQPRRPGVARYSVVKEPPFLAGSILTRQLGQLRDQRFELPHPSLPARPCPARIRAEPLFRPARRERLPALLAQTPAQSRTFSSCGPVCVPLDHRASLGHERRSETPARVSSCGVTSARCDARGGVRQGGHPGSPENTAVPATYHR